MCLCALIQSSATFGNDGSAEATSADTRQVANRLADAVMTDAVYDQTITALAFTLKEALRQGGMPRPLRRAERKDNLRFMQALVESVKLALPKEKMKPGLARALTAEFSAAELSQILAFASTEVGRRYLALSSDEKFTTALFNSINFPDETAWMAILIGQMHRQFPDMGFDKRAPR